LNSLNNAAAAGDIFVAAAGNASSNNDLTPSYPASYTAPNIIAVAATNNKDQLASFSNYGTNSVDIAAPGVDVASTYPNNGYVYLSGTSMATPHVTGVVALVLSQSPALSYSDVIGRVLNGADVLPGLSSSVAGGRGLHAFNAVNVGATDKTGPRVTAAVPNGTASASRVRLTFSEAIDVANFTTADITNPVGLTGIG